MCKHTCTWNHVLVQSAQLAGARGWEWGGATQAPGGCQSLPCGSEGVGEMQKGRLGREDGQKLGGDEVGGWGGERS